MGYRLILPCGVVLGLAVFVGCQREAPRAELNGEVLPSATDAESALPSDPAARAMAMDAWFARAQEHAAKVAEQDEKTSAWGIIAMHFAWEGRWDEAVVTMMRSKHKLQIAHDQGYLAAYAASVGEAARAIEIARMTSEPKWQDLVLVRVAESQAEDRHDFEGALRTLELISGNPDQTSRGWYCVARTQAEAGQYAAARGTAAKIVPRTDEDRQYHRELLNDIDQCEAEGRRDPPFQRKDPDTPLVESSRETIGMSGDFDETTDLEDAKARADLIETAGERGTRWRQIAWAYFQRGDRRACRRAIESALVHVEDGELPGLRALNYATLADLYLDLGERKAARRLARKATDMGSGGTRTGTIDGNTLEEIAADFKEDVYSDIGTMFIVPYTVGVLVRCDEIDEAARLVEQYPKFRVFWSCLGAHCAAEGRLDEVEKRIEALESEEAKMYLCLGVIQALSKRDQ